MLLGSNGKGLAVWTTLFRVVAGLSSAFAVFAPNATLAVAAAAMKCLRLRSCVMTRLLHLVTFPIGASVRRSPLLAND
jgi:hypothetical protein